MNAVGTQNKRESSHFAIASKSTFPKVTGDNCWLHPLFTDMKLKVTMYFFKWLHLPSLCTRRLCCLPLLKKIVQRERTTTLMQADFRFSESWQVKRKKKKSVDWCFTLYFYSCASVKGAKRNKRLTKNPMFLAVDLNCRFAVCFQDPCVLWWQAGLTTRLCMAA